jgi:hypothetical protein
LLKTAHVKIRPCLNTSQLLIFTCWSTKVAGEKLLCGFLPKKPNQKLIT